MGQTIDRDDGQRHKTECNTLDPDRYGFLHSLWLLRCQSLNYATAIPVHGRKIENSDAVNFVRQSYNRANHSKLL